MYGTQTSFFFCVCGRTLGKIEEKEKKNDPHFVLMIHSTGAQNGVECVTVYYSLHTGWNLLAWIFSPLSCNYVFRDISPSFILFTFYPRVSFPKVHTLSIFQRSVNSPPPVRCTLPFQIYRHFPKLQQLALFELHTVLNDCLRAHLM